MATIWEEVKGRIKGALPNRTFSLWINPLTYLERDDDTLVLACPNKFSRNWITENYRRVIEEELGKMGNGVSKLSLTVKSPNKENQEPDIFQDPEQLSRAGTAARLIGPARTPCATRRGCSPSWPR